MHRFNVQQLVLDMNINWTPVITATVCGTGALYLFFKWRKNQEIQKKILNARKRRDTSLLLAEQAVQQFKIQNPGFESSSIVSLSLSELAGKLKDGSLQPDAVLHAFMEKALEVNRDLNCSTEILMESVVQLEDIKSQKKGLLYGVPISIKDNISYEGHDTSCGVVSKLDQPALADSVVVKVLKKQGAIPFIKTNIPQGLLNYDCSNPIYGQTLNPCNLQKSPGGSSGGEAALIGGGGSLLGIGTDIAGSIRIPASFCGICGFKPTAMRISARGISSCIKGQKSVLSSFGPLARDVESLSLCMQALLCQDMFSLDPTVPPIPFNQEMYESSEPLRIGYYENDGYLQPSPSMARAFRETKDLLERAGHTLVPFQPLRLYHVFHELTIRGIMADKGRTLISHLKPGPIDPCIRNQDVILSTPSFIMKLISFVLKPFCPRMSASIDATHGVGSVAELWRIHANIEEYIHEVIAEWRRLNLDVLLCPMLGPAYNFTYCGRLNSALSYTSLYNLLNFPAGTVPVSAVTEEDEAQLSHYKGAHGDMWDKLFVKAVKGGVGLPVTVQCVSLPWQDEMCLRFMREVEHLTAKNKLTRKH
ncbi:vitamin D3 hydroxylase-associated protein [Carassius auratus]|uniref:Fatty-acid amide hydrolase 1 n=1 Tax=Carassius auratus TaxID=7957 RepID=A0A6P6KEY0_CARAU|nr:vitamin D3 hydroxylase-associated protein-like [Carassius auratus]XP_052454883.1 vitamin D3 hydroxylase-associated protein [Carassius gibelio]